MSADHISHIIKLAKDLGATVPENGKTYWLQNLKYSHFLNVEFSKPDDGARLLAWNRETNKNEQFRYTNYYNGKSEKVFTLECVSTLESKNQVGGHGGYMRVDPKSNGVIQGGAPMPWKLVEVVAGIYRLTPFDDVFSKDGTLVLEDAQAEITTADNNKLTLVTKKHVEEAPLEQYWIFTQLK